MNGDKHAKVEGSAPSNKIPKASSQYAGTIVRIDDYDPINHLVKVSTRDGKPLEKDFETREAVVQKKPYEQPTSKIMKTSRAPDGPIMEVNNDNVSVRGNSGNGLFVYKEGGGTIVKGAFSAATTADQFKIAGMHTFNPIALSGFPSTIVTPIPTFLWAIPTTAAIKPILKDVAVMSTLMAGLKAVG